MANTGLVLFLCMHVMDRDMRLLAKEVRRFNIAAPVFGPIMFYFKFCSVLEFVPSCLWCQRADKICMVWTFHLSDFYSLYKSKENGAFYGWSSSMFDVQPGGRPR